jgi:hypothetical protein
MLILSGVHTISIETKHTSQNSLTESVIAILVATEEMFLCLKTENICLFTFMYVMGTEASPLRRSLKGERAENNHANVWMPLLGS